MLLYCPKYCYFSTRLYNGWFSLSSPHFIQETKARRHTLACETFRHHENGWPQQGLFTMPRSLRRSVLHCLKDERSAIRWWGWWQAQCLEYYVLSFIEDKMILSISFSFCRSFLAAFSLSCFLLNCLLKARSPTSSSLENRIIEVFLKTKSKLQVKNSNRQSTHRCRLKKQDWLYCVYDTQRLAIL